MKLLSKHLACAALALGLQGCPSSTVPFDQASSNDTSPPLASVRVDTSLTTTNQSGIPASNLVSSFEAAARTPGQPQNAGHTVDTASELDITASASDNESGIKELTLYVNRTIFYTTAIGNNLVSTVMPSRLLKQVTNVVTNGQVPKVAIAAFHTGIGTERDFTNASGTITHGTGVTLQYFVEARNFSGQTTQTDTVTLISGRVTP